MRSKTAGKLVVLAVLVAMVITAAGITSAQGPRVVNVALLGQDDVPSLDPSLAQDVSGIQVLEMLMPGMTILNETTVMVEPGIAESWDYVVNDDGTATYTFVLRQGIPWVRYDASAGAVVEVTDDNGDVRYVNANDVVFGWRRSLNPETLSYYGEVLAQWVIGGDDMISIEVGEDGVDPALLAEAEANLGITATGDYEIQIVGPGEYAFLPNIYGMWMARPQPAWAIEAYGDGWTEPANMNTYGPFALKEWRHDESITLVKNPFWPATDYIPMPQIDELTNYFLEQSAMVANYEAGELQFVSPVAPSDVDRLAVEYPAELRAGPGQCTLYYGMNTEKAPFDNVHMRRAFTLAIDRDILSTLRKSGDVPAAFFTRPDMVAAPQQAAWADTEVALLTAPPEQREAAAKAELELYFEETGTTMADLPAITLQYNDSETWALVSEVMQEMYSNVLGINVELNSMEWASHLDALQNDAPQVFRVAWCFDYPDANNWMFDVFRSDSNYATDGGNSINWVNEEFDALLFQAAAETDVELRRDLYGQAEYILVWEDAGIMPIFYYGQNLLVSPSLDAPFSNTGIERFDKWVLVE